MAIKIDKEKLEKAITDNSDLPTDFIEGALIAREEIKAGMTTEYQFDKKKKRGSGKV